MGDICSLLFGCGRSEDVDPNHAQQKEEERIIGTGSFPKNGPKMERINEMEKLYKQKEQLEGELKQKLQRAESALRQKQEELDSLRRRCEQQELERKKEINEMEKQKEQLEGELKKKVQEAEESRRHKEEELKSLQLRSARQQKEAELKAFRKSIADMETLHKEQLHEERSARQQKEEELKALRKRLDAGLTAGCRRCEQQEREHRESMTEMEAFYKDKLQEARSAVKQKEEELKSFRERLAADVSVSLKAGDTESINDPVSKTRLVEMYDVLKLLHWPKMKEALKAAALQPQEARALLQVSFEAAAQAMKKKRQLIEEAFGAAGPSRGAGPQKVREYRQITVGNLKMAVFHSSKADLLQTHLPEHGGGLPQSVQVDVGPLLSECFWLGCLMALNSPPLQPDWENHTPGMDPWDLFPRDIKPYSAV